MSQGAYLAIAIALIVALLVFSVWGFIHFKRMPVPKGCEDMVANEEKCGGCVESGCPLYAKYHKKEEEGK